ncbi:MAG: hypothetical protein ACREHD_06750 [Pirellulales bacterium]
MEIPELSVVRQQVLVAFCELGAGDGNCSEVVLIKDRHVTGRRFCLGGIQAVWLAGDDHLSIFSEAGELIASQRLEVSDVPLRKAA